MSKTTFTYTKQIGKPITMIPLSYFKEYKETLYLMKSSNNAMRLNKAIKEFKNNENLK